MIAKYKGLKRVVVNNFRSGNLQAAKFLLFISFSAFQMNFLATCIDQSVHVDSGLGVSELCAR
jgi:hypothetical protein